MTGHIERRLAGLACAVVVLAFGVQPVLADTERGHTGVVGFHKLVDKSTSAGVMCMYTPIEPSDSAYFYMGELVHLYVWPPKVRAISGTQEVGWRFIVQRRTEWDELSNYWSPWAARYRSPIQRKVTSTTESANFSQKDIPVIIPDNLEYRYEYRVLVKMYWFRSDGRIQATATHRVDWYQQIYSYWPGEGDDAATYSEPCFALVEP
jgi:hypothetical protein